MKGLFLTGCVAVFLCLLTHTCTPVRDIQFRQTYRDLDELMVNEALLEGKPYLKAHMQNGDVIVLSNQWEIDTLHELVRGFGTHYDFNRRIKTRDSIDLKIEEIILFETNQLPKNRNLQRKAGIYLLGAANIAMTTICLINPKACFGSCPTFYLNEDDPMQIANAEAFSNAIAPALEYRDIDALRAIKPAGASFELTMKNEAFETHFVRNVDVLAVPLKEGEDACHTPDDRIFVTRKRQPPILASAEEGEITWLLSHEDQNERFSLSDPKNLRSKETIFIQFENHNRAKPKGLTVGFRQSLMTTFLLYNALDYMGHMAGDILAGIDPKDGVENSTGGVLKKKLGGVDVYLWDSKRNEWIFQDSFYETGPIAINHQMIPLSEETAGEDTLKIKLELNKGMWRLDYVHLAEIVREVEPLVINPSKATEKNSPGVCFLNNLLNPEDHLVSLPGDVFRFQFELPDEESEYALFLAAKGYYLIWNREEWIQEKDLKSLIQMRYQPRTYLKRQAAAYKEYEKTMEDLFWNSRVTRQIISGHE